MSKILAQVFAPCLFLLFVCNPICGQTATATLSGTIQDQNSAVVPGVVVSVRNDAQGFDRNVATNESGYFTIPFLPPGTYTLTATRTGFAVARVTDVVLNVGDQKSLRLALKIGDVKSEVVVSPDAVLVSTSPAISNTIDQTFVRNLPLNGRSFQTLILLTPGIVQTNANPQSAPGEFSVNGQRSNANYFTVDGVGANIGVSTSGFNTGLSQQQSGSLPGFSALGTTGNLVSVDALEEFKIQTSTYSAENGRQPGAQVQLVTRSGKADFRATVFEFVRNEALDANDWFANRNRLPKAALRQNQFGGTFGGPIILPRFGEGEKAFWNGRKSTFFFFSYEGLRMLLPVNNLGFVPLVPSLRLREIAPAAIKPLLNMYPRPTDPEILTTSGQPLGLSPFNGSYSSPRSLDAVSVRVDHSIGDKVLVFGRYNHAPSRSLNRQLSFLTGNQNTTKTLTLGATFATKKQWSNELRFNYSSNRGRFTSSMDDFGGAIPIDPAVLVSGYSGAGVKQGGFSFLPEGNVAPFIGDFTDSFQRQINLVDNVSVIVKNHRFRLGVDYRRLAPIYGPLEYSQYVYFNSEADLLSSTVTNLSRSAEKGARPLFDNFSAYVQDTWKASDRLTVDLGLRWELNPSPGEVDGRKPLLVAGVENDLRTATLAPEGSPIFKTVYTAFAPRFGMAYLLRQRPGGETVIRGGVGLYYDLGNGQATAGFRGFPFTVGAGDTNVPYPLPAEFARPPALEAVTLPITTTLSAFNPDLTLPYTWQWNIAGEQSLGANQVVSVSYVAAAARRLTTSQLLNQRLGNPTNGTRPNPNFGPIRFVSNGPASDYHSMQTQYRRRLSGGMQLIANYTWSHAIDEVSNEVEQGTLERGNADFDVRHNFSSAVSYEVPRVKSSNRLVSVLLGGWAVDGIVFVQSGSPINLTAGNFIREDSTQISVRPDLVLGVPLWVEDSTLPGGRRINRLAFAEPPRITGSFYSRQGTLGRNVVRLPSRYQTNISLRRRIKFGEGRNVQLRADVFNVFNHPLFGSYSNNIRLSTFGRAQSMLNRSLGGLDQLYQIGGPRSLQLSARVEF